MSLTITKLLLNWFKKEFQTASFVVQELMNIILSTDSIKLILTSVESLINHYNVSNVLLFH